MLAEIFKTFKKINFILKLVAKANLLKLEIQMEYI